jgi:hypothetical protein
LLRRLIGKKVMLGSLVQGEAGGLATCQIETEVRAAIGKEAPRRSERSTVSELFVEKQAVYSSCAPAASQTQDKVQRGLLLNVVVGERAAIIGLQAVCLRI